MKSYEIIKTDKPNWDKIEGVTLSHTKWLPKTDIEATAKASYNDDKIFIHLEAKEENIRAELKGLYEMVCCDSCLEFFFAPMLEDNRYFNFEWNPNGASYIGFGTGRYVHYRQIILDADKLFNPKPFKTADGWGIDFEIPYSFIKLYFPEFKPEGKSHCNFYKCGDLTKIPHYLSWSEMTSDHPEFHKRSDFSELIYK